MESSQSIFLVGPCKTPQVLLQDPINYLCSFVGLRMVIETMHNLVPWS